MFSKLGLLIRRIRRDHTSSLLPEIRGAGLGPAGPWPVLVTSQKVRLIRERLSTRESTCAITRPSCKIRLLCLANHISLYEHVYMMRRAKPCSSLHVQYHMDTRSAASRDDLCTTTLCNVELFDVAQHARSKSTRRGSFLHNLVIIDYKTTSRECG